MFQTQQLRQQLQQVQQICQQMSQQINQIDSSIMSQQQQQRNQQMQMGSDFQTSQFQGGQYPQQMTSGSQLTQVPMGSTNSMGSTIGSSNQGMGMQGMGSQFGSSFNQNQMGMGSSQMGMGSGQLGQTAPLSSMEPSHNSNKYGQKGLW